MLAEQMHDAMHISVQVFIGIGVKFTALEGAAAGAEDMSYSGILTARVI